MVSASARRWDRVNQLVTWPRIAEVAQAAASATALLGPGPGFGSTSPSWVRSRVHPSGPLWLVQ
eukprot:10981018-Alexandrium_andersonii.AAC.1